MSNSHQKNKSHSKTALSPQARRAIKEAEKRREKVDGEAERQATEVDGRDGPDPTRYGDWEKNGIISDF